MSYGRHRPGEMSFGTNALLLLTALAIAWVVRFLFRCLMAYFVFLYRNPWKGALLFAIAIPSMWLMTYFDYGPRAQTFNIIGADQETVQNVYGNPWDCGGSAEFFSCKYGNYDHVNYVNGRATEYTFSGLRGETFDNSEDFYRRVLNRLKIDYRAPTTANQDVVQWTNIPGLGSVTVTSDAQLNVATITVQG